MSVVQPDDAQVAAALKLVVDQQQDAATACPYVGTNATGVQEELEALSPPWRETLRVLVRAGEVVACACVDLDVEDTARSWIHGPWAVDQAAWDSGAEPLLEAMLDLVPQEIEDHEICGTPTNGRLLALGERRGWHRSVVNIAYVARSDEGWPGEDGRVRTATAEDLSSIARLHDAAFPGTYASARGLLADEGRVTLVLDDGSGYASGEVQADGDGYLDFLAVDPGAQGQGLGRALLASIGRRMLAASASTTLNLTVRADNAPAVALYENFGFVRDLELVACRSRPYAT